MKTWRVSNAGCRVLLLLALWWASDCAAALSREECSDLFSQGRDLFRQANELAGTDAEAARDMYRKAALRFERIVRAGGVQNGRLHYNIGNAYFRMNDLGRAILSYRRAELYTPNDPNLKQNLAFARKRRLDRIEDAQRRKVLHTIFFWHYDLPSKARALAFSLCFLAVWICAAAKLFSGRPFLTWALVASVALSALLLASLSVETISRRTRREGVVTAPQVTARKGDSETYEPSFKEPLHAGTEFVLVETRGDWYQVSLADGRRCWLPTHGAQLVR